MRELLDAIAAAPDDDAPRRVYADALLEAGDPQGELIHLQCELAAGGLTREQTVMRRRRERELINAYGSQWIAPLRGLASDPVIRRGFVDEVVVDADQFPHIGDRLFEAAPALRGVKLDGLTTSGIQEDEAAAAAQLLKRWQHAITCRAFRRLRGVGLGAYGYECREFGEVTPGWDSVTDQALAALMKVDVSALTCIAIHTLAYRGHPSLYTSPQFAKLAHLAIYPDNLGDSQDLFEALPGTAIRSLTLGGEYLGMLTYPALWTLASLRIQAMDLDLEKPLDNLERFAFATETIRDEPVDRAVRFARNVRELSFDGDRVPGWKRLATAELPNLRSLRVHGSDVGFAEAEAILRMPCAANLDVLYLKSIDDLSRARLEDQFGVVVDVIDAARSYVYWR